MKRSLRKSSTLPFILVLCFAFGCARDRQGENAALVKKAQDDLQLTKIPQVVMDGLKAKFPKAEIRKWSEEKEGDITVYDIEFKQDGWKFEADIKADGSIHNWEKAIEAKDLPEVAKAAAESEYPKSGIKEIMQITAVSDGKDVLEGYEIVLETSDGKHVEVTVAPDGKVLEDSGKRTPKEE